MEDTGLSLSFRFATVTAGLLMVGFVQEKGLPTPPDTFYKLFHCVADLAREAGVDIEQLRKDTYAILDNPRAALERETALCGAPANKTPC